MDAVKLIAAAREIDRLARIQAARSKRWQQLAHDAKQPGSDRRAIRQRKQQLDAGRVVDFSTAIRDLQAALRSRKPAEPDRFAQLLDACTELANNWRQQALAEVPEDYRTRGLESKYLKLDNAAAGVDGCAFDLAELVEKHRGSEEP